VLRNHSLLPLHCVPRRAIRTSKKLFKVALDDDAFALCD